MLKKTDYSFYKPIQLVSKVYHVV